ncbi:AP-4 complex accessory subunit RUSC2 [Polymixia lowei]
MIRASSLSGDTLIACHFPVVQLPPWQLSVQTLCSSAKRPGRLCSAGLTRAVSLPEQDSLRTEPALPASPRHISSSCSSLKEERAEEEEEEEEEEEGASDSSGRYDSTPSPGEASERAESRRKTDAPGTGGSLRSRNSFLPSTELDEEDEDSDGDNLHRYHEDSSFVLHGNSNWPLTNGGRNSKMPIGDVDSIWDKEPSMLDTETGREWLSNQPNQLDLLQIECQCFQVSGSSNTLINHGEQDSARQKDNMSCFTFSQPKCFPESSSIGQPESVSDSSCNSSDGVLVNFCTIYNKSNNPATPHDLSSPALQPCQSEEGSVFLNLQPVTQTPDADLQRRDRTASFLPQDEMEAVPSAPRWSPQGLDSNCNLYSLDPLSQGLSSLEVSDLTACLRSQATLTMGTNQKYYKLVTCDLPSQSPSPAWSSLTSYPEGQSRRSPVLPSEYLFFNKGKEGQPKKEKKEEKEQQKESRRSSSAQSSAGVNHPQSGSYESQTAASHTEQAFCKEAHTDKVICHSYTFKDLCSIQASVSPGQRITRSSVNQGTGAVSTEPSVILDQEHCHTDTEEEGACSWATPVVRYSKAQRPTSLPIQPFVLLPTGKPQTQHLGSLLDQYISKSSKSSSSQPGSKCKGKGNRLLAHLQPSPLGNHGPILLEAPSSSDTCSTCTPSPECFNQRRTWSQSSTGQGHISPCRSRTSLALPQTSPKPKTIKARDNTSPYAGTTETSTVLNVNSTNPSPTPFTPPQNQSSLVKVPTCQDLIYLTPEQTHGSTEPKHRSPIQSQTHSYCHSVFSHTPPTLPPTSHTHHPNVLVCLSSPTIPEPEKKIVQHPSAPTVERSGFLHNSLTAALASVTPLSSLSSLLSLAGSGLHPQQSQDPAGPSGKQSQSQHGDSLILSDRPPTEFCPSPDASYESMSISHLQRRGLLRSVSVAVDLIMAHFGSSRDPEEKMRLGNSSRSPTIAGLVLEHLCPTIQNILEDGLRDHKLDLIVGQRRNHCWSVVEVSIQTGPFTRVLQSLVSKIRQCPQLTSHCMRLRAFIMGLLNLRALEFWLSHLQGQKDVVTTYYHSWAFLSMSQQQCQPLFQELLLLLQPLSVLPFDLNLLLEPRLLRNRQLCSEEQCIPPLLPSSTLLMTSWPQLLAERQVAAGQRSRQTGDSHQTDPHLQVTSQKSCSHQQERGEKHAEVAQSSPWSALSPEWWQRQPVLVDGVAEGEDPSQNCTDARPRSQRGMNRRQDERSGERETGRASSGLRVLDESPRGGLRWATLFGAAVDASSRRQGVSQNLSGTQPKRYRRPSQWLQLDRSELGLLAQSVWSVKLGGAKTDKD